MNKLTKGALSAVAAAALLLGGAGSLAYWNDSQNATGTTVNSGHLKLNTTTAGVWKLNAESTAYNPSTQKLVPGDQLKKVATFTVDSAGDYLNATFAAANPAWAGGSSAALTSELTLSGSYEVSTDGGSTWSAPSNGQTPVTIHNGDLVRATLIINWPFGSLNNNSNVAAGLTATLNDVAVTVTQVP